MSNLDQRRADFADKLRRLREEAGYLNGKDLAARLDWQPSKVSRVENGRQTATSADVSAWADAVRASESVAAELREELYALTLERNRWSRQPRTGHRARQEYSREIEQDTARIRVFELAVLPGLVQTAEYARCVFLAGAELHRSPRDTDTAVRARLQRQSVLHDKDTTVEILIAESALRYPLCSPEVMNAQLDRILALFGLESVRIGVLPFDVALPVVPIHGVWLLDDLAVAETLDSETTSRDPETVALYERYLDQLWSVAVEGKRAREILTRSMRG